MTSTERAQMIERHLPLVRAIASRFGGRGEPLEDLVQVGSVALISAVDRCRPGAEARFHSYAAVCVEGEIRRHLRDLCLPLRIPRRLHGDAALMATLRTPAALEGEAEAVTVPEAPEDDAVARAFVASAARVLDRRERRMLAMRYFLDLSQAEIGHAVGLSQVQVGRVLEGALVKMRRDLAPEPGAAGDAGRAGLGSGKRGRRSSVTGD